MFRFHRGIRTCIALSFCAYNDALRGGQCQLLFSRAVKTATIDGEKKEKYRCAIIAEHCIDVGKCVFVIIFLFRVDIIIWSSDVNNCLCVTQTLCYCNEFALYVCPYGRTIQPAECQGRFPQTTVCYYRLKTVR